MAGLSRGVKIFLAVDVLLVLGLVVAAIVVLGGGSDDGGTAASSAPASTAASGTSAAPGDGSSTAPADDATAGTETQTFASPSGNISCTMSVDGVTCSIAHITFTPPVVEGCTGSTGHVIVLNTTDGVTTPCVDGADPSVASADVPVLEYGRSERVGPYQCTSATNGVTCVVDESATGFRVATAELALLP
jgi:hypothetical protein